MNYQIEKPKRLMIFRSFTRTEKMQCIFNTPASVKEEQEDWVIVWGKRLICCVFPHKENRRVTPPPAYREHSICWEETTQKDEWLQPKQFDGQTLWVMCDIVPLPSDLYYTESVMDPESTDTLIYNLTQCTSERHLVGIWSAQIFILWWGR